MEVRLRKDFYGTKIAKVSSDSLMVLVPFTYKGLAQTLRVEVNTGKRGAWGDYDQESPAYYYDKAVSSTDTLAYYSLIAFIPLSFWGTRKIDDCAVEVVISGEDVYDDAVLWDAYTVNLAAPPLEIELQPGSNTVKWMGSPTSVSVTLAEIIDYVQAFYALINGLWVIKGGSWIIPTNQICLINVDRACTVSGFVWELSKLPPLPNVELEAGYLRRYNG